MGVHQIQPAERRSVRHHRRTAHEGLGVLQGRGRAAPSSSRDRRTGYPARGTASVSVIAPRTIDSEAWAKPFFINGRAWTVTHKPANMRVFVCDDATDREVCTWVQ